MTRSLLFTLPSLSPRHSKFPRVLAICRAVDRRSYRPIVSVDHPGRLHGEGERLLREIDVPVLLLRMSPHRSNIAGSMWGLLQSRALLRKEHIAIQHSLDYSRWWSEPLVARSAGVEHWVTTKASMDSRDCHWRIRLGLADHIVVQSPEMLELLKKNHPMYSDRLFLIRNGVDTDMFRPRARDDRLAGELGLAGSGLVLGCVAHLSRRKDHASLLEALALSVSKNIELLLIGAIVESTYKQELTLQITRLGLKKRVHFLGERHDLARLHSIMDGIVLTSKDESSSNAVLEGMSSGLPVITSDVGGMRDAVAHGANGWVIPRDEGFVGRLATAINEWSCNEQTRRAFGQESRRIILDKFPLSKMVARHVDFYDSLV